MADMKPIPRFVAVNAVINAIKLGDRFTFEELCVKIERVIISSGGKQDINATERTVKRVAKIAAALGLFQLTTVTYIQRYETEVLTEDA